MKAFNTCFFFENESIIQDISPHQRGGRRVSFLIENERLEYCVSPLERGLRGCVTVRGAT